MHESGEVVQDVNCIKINQNLMIIVGREMPIRERGVGSRIRFRLAHDLGRQFIKAVVVVVLIKQKGKVHGRVIVVVRGCWRDKGGEDVTCSNAPINVKASFCGSTVVWQQQAMLFLILFLQLMMKKLSDAVWGPAFGGH